MLFQVDQSQPSKEVCLGSWYSAWHRSVNLEIFQQWGWWLVSKSSQDSIKKLSQKRLALCSVFFQGKAEDWSKSTCTGNKTLHIETLEIFLQPMDLWKVNLCSLSWQAVSTGQFIFAGELCRHSRGDITPSRSNSGLCKQDLNACHLFAECPSLPQRKRDDKIRSSLVALIELNFSLCCFRFVLHLGFSSWCSAELGLLCCLPDWHQWNLCLC